MVASQETHAVNPWLHALAVICAPPIAALTAGVCALLNVGRARPLPPGARTAFAQRFPELDLTRVRVVDRALLPLQPRFVGLTLGHHIYLRARLDDSPAMRRLLAHELAHVRQFASLGFAGMARAYGALWLAYGYSGHPMEVEARSAEGNETP
jgi:hypothetical protein